MKKKTNMPRSPGRQRGKKAPSEKTGGSAWYKKIMAEIRDRFIWIDKKKVLIVNIPYVIVLYLIDKAAWLYRHCVGDTLLERAGVLFLNFNLAFKNPLIVWQKSMGLIIA